MKGFDLYQPPHNHNKLSNFNLEDELNLSIPEQGLPATKLKVVEVRETNLLVSYKDPLSVRLVKHLLIQPRTQVIFHILHLQEIKNLSLKGLL